MGLRLVTSWLRLYIFLNLTIEISWVVYHIRWIGLLWSLIFKSLFINKSLYISNFKSTVFKPIQKN